MFLSVGQQAVLYPQQSLRLLLPRDTTDDDVVLDINIFNTELTAPVKAGEILLKPTRESFKKHLCFVYDGSVDIRVSELPDNDAAILGAAALTKAK